MILQDERWFVAVTKRKPKSDGTPDIFKGTCRNDGLQSLWTITLPDGSVRYASVLDDIKWLATLPKP